MKSSLNLILLGVYASKQQEEAEGERDKRLKRIFLLEIVIVISSSYKY